MKCDLMIGLLHRSSHNFNEQDEQQNSLGGNGQASLNLPALLTHRREKNEFHRLVVNPNFLKLLGRDAWV